MSEHLNKNNHSSADIPAEEQYFYRWNYSDQVAFDRSVEEKKKKSGILVYTLILSAVFFVCFSVLACLLIWNQSTGSAQRFPDGDALTTAEVSRQVSPATVMVFSAKMSGYGYGTGFFITENGYIVTNHHVIEDALAISVRLYNGQELPATLIGGSPEDDIAVLQIEGRGFPFVIIGDSDMLNVGDRAIAIGNPSGEEGSWTTTQGIISALNRKISVTGEGYIGELTMIQTDAPVNTGNSGGPLCNEYGEVIGIVTRKLSDYEGIGYAIPINAAMETVTAIINGTLGDHDSSVSQIRPTIGITVQNINKGEQYSLNGQLQTASITGVIISQVDQTGGAYGLLEVGDIIFSLDGKSATTMEELQQLLYGYRVGDVIKVKAMRGNTAIEVSVTLGVKK